MAFLLDWALITAASYLALAYPNLFPAYIQSLSLHGSLTLIVAVSVAVEFVFLTTPGKLVLRLKISGPRDRLGFRWRAGLRALLFWVFILAPGSLLPALGEVAPASSLELSSNVLAIANATLFTTMLLPALTIAISSDAQGLVDHICRCAVVGWNSDGGLPSNYREAKRWIRETVGTAAGAWAILGAFWSVLLYDANLEHKLDFALSTYEPYLEASVPIIEAESMTGALGSVGIKRLPVYPIAAGVGLPFTTISLRFSASEQMLKLPTEREWTARLLSNYARAHIDQRAEAQYIQLSHLKEFGLAVREQRLAFTSLPFIDVIVPYFPELVGAKREGSSIILPTDSLGALDADSAQIVLEFRPKLQTGIYPNLPIGGWRFGSFHFSRDVSYGSPTPFHARGLLRMTREEYPPLPRFVRYIHVRDLIFFEPDRYSY